MRDLIVPALRKRWPSARIIHELPLRYSTNRIDLAAVTETEIVSIEIKSSKDVMDRLEAQLRGFIPISSRVIVALAPKWNEKLPLEAVPAREGVVSYRRLETPTQELIGRVGGASLEVWTVDAVAQSIEITQPGRHRANRPWLAEMLNLLHVGELLNLASEYRVSTHKRSTHDFLVTTLVDLLQGREVVRGVCGALRNRDAFDKMSDPPMSGPSMASGSRPEAQRLFL